MKTAKEMLAIAEAVRKEQDALLVGERTVMELIASAVKHGNYYVYVNWRWSRDLVEKLESHGYEVSEAIHEGESGWERRISWDCEAHS